MILEVSIFAGYIATGFGVVGNDMSEPIYNQPAYVRDPKARWLVTTLWPFKLIANYRFERKSMFRRNGLLVRHFGASIASMFMFSCATYVVLKLIVAVSHFIGITGLNP